MILISAAMRLIALPAAPAGLNQDEAANAWNAWCLLQTGRDQAGTPWPVFWTHALGENRSALYLYTLLPFQALGGMNVWTTRLPAAVAGILTVALVGWIAARLFDRTTGVVAAGLAAFAPWYIDLSRWGHEASVGPLLTALSLAALLWAGLLRTDRDEPPATEAGTTFIPCRASAWRTALAGLISGAGLLRISRGADLSAGPHCWRSGDERCGAMPNPGARDRRACPRYRAWASHPI